MSYEYELTKEAIAKDKHLHNPSPQSNQDPNAGLTRYMPAAIPESGKMPVVPATIGSRLIDWAIWIIFLMLVCVVGYIVLTVILSL